MIKIKPINPENATEATNANFELVNKKLGRIPNMYKVMANSPAVLDAYIKLNSALSAGNIGNKMAELIALATAEQNKCSYCLSAHTYLGEKVGLSKEMMHLGRKFQAENKKIKTGLLFAQKILDSPKTLTSNDIEPLREIGYTDGEILEIVANVIRNIFTNYVNIISETEIDWPQIVQALPQENELYNI